MTRENDLAGALQRRPCRMTAATAASILAARGTGRIPVPNRMHPATPSTRTCLSCGLRHPFTADGEPVGGALACGH